jgi:hypothetical protein
LTNSSLTPEDYSTLAKSRQEAQARNLDRYFTNIPCKHGHLAPRYTRGMSCVACQLEHARRSGGWQARPSRERYLTELRDIVGQRGGVLLSTEYVSARTKVRVRVRYNPRQPEARKVVPRMQTSKSFEARMAANLRSVEELREFARERHGGDCLATSPSTSKLAGRTIPDTRRRLVPILCR